MCLTVISFFVCNFQKTYERTYNSPWFYFKWLAFKLETKTIVCPGSNLNPLSAQVQWSRQTWFEWETPHLANLRPLSLPASWVQTKVFSKLWVLVHTLHSWYEWYGNQRFWKQLRRELVIGMCFTLPKSWHLDSAAAAAGWHVFRHFQDTSFPLLDASSCVRHCREGTVVGR